MTPIRGWCCGKTLSSTIFWVQLWASVMLRGDVLGQKGRWSTWDTLGVYWRRNSTTCKHIRAYTCACVSEFALITRELKIPFLFTFLFLLPIRPRRRCLRVQIHLTVKADLSVAPAANGRKVEITQRWPNSAAMSSDAAAAAESLQSCPTLRPHRRQPTRFCCPWDSPGKNTGVGCHFLLQCMKVKSESEIPQSCPTPSDLMDCSLPGSFIHGIFQARVLEWGAMQSPLVVS